VTVPALGAGGHLVAGVDSSTQSCTVVLCRAEDGVVVARGSAPHPPGTEVDPAAWWAALCQAGDGLLERADAIGVAGQQHGMVVLDSAGEVVRPALLWNDLRSAQAADELVAVEAAGRAGDGVRAPRPARPRAPLRRALAPGGRPPGGIHWGIRDLRSGDGRAGAAR
jgi:sugar (pentulose or hexulose) kinase